MDEVRAVDQEIQEIVRQLVTNYPPEKIILFGSHARDVPEEDSDIDLLIIKETSDRFLDRWAMVRRILSDPNRTVGLDVIVLTPQEMAQRLKVGDQFIAEILEKGKVLYAV